MNGKLVKRLNSFFLILIPKSENPIRLGDYRPISLLNCVFKLLEKVLAGRIKKAIPKIVGKVQSTFVKGRGLQDGIANEIVDYWRLNKGIVLKLDFHKAYDSINCNFLFSMLEGFGFDVK